LQAFWVSYVVVAATTTISGARAYHVGAGLQPVLAAAAGYELGIGALALAIQASLAWSDEKNAGREGVDLLLSTPLSAVTVINGKWRGVYRFIAPVVAFPVISSLIVLGDAPKAPALEPVTGSLLTAMAVVALVFGQTLVYGAAFVSLGIFLATRCAKPSHAVFWAVGIYFMVAVIFPTVVEMLFLWRDRPLSEGLAIASPIAAPIAVIMTRFPGPYFGPAQAVFPYAAMWLVVAAGIGWALHRWTIWQFDRWMGRVPAPGRRSGFAVVPARAALE
jgi:hypothetical protein